MQFEYLYITLAFTYKTKCFLEMKHFIAPDKVFLAGGGIIMWKNGCGGYKYDFSQNTIFKWASMENHLVNSHLNDIVI